MFRISNFMSNEHLFITLSFSQPSHSIEEKVEAEKLMKLFFITSFLWWEPGGYWIYRMGHLFSGLVNGLLSSRSYIKKKLYGFHFSWWHVSSIKTFSHWTNNQIIGRFRDMKKTNCCCVGKKVNDIEGSESPKKVSSEESLSIFPS